MQTSRVVDDAVDQLAKLQRKSGDTAVRLANEQHQRRVDDLCAAAATTTTLEELDKVLVASNQEFAGNFACPFGGINFSDAAGLLVKKDVPVAKLGAAGTHYRGERYNQRYAVAGTPGSGLLYRGRRRATGCDEGGVRGNDEGLQGLAASPEDAWLPWSSHDKPWTTPRYMGCTQYCRPEHVLANLDDLEGLMTTNTWPSSIGCRRRTRCRRWRR